jgi:ketosteroid isomerase-like protein
MRPKNLYGIMMIFSLCLCLYGAPSASSATAEEELIQLEKDWSNAMLNHDVAFFDRVMADDMMVTDVEGNLQTKAQFLADWRAGIFTFTSIVFDDMKIRIWGDTGVVWGRTTEKSQYKGKDTSGQYQWTDVFNKSSGRWQFVAGHMSRLMKK